MKRKNKVTLEVLRHPDFDKAMEENYDFIVEQSKKLGSKLKKDPNDLIGSFVLRLNKSLWSYRPNKKTKFQSYMCCNFVEHLRRDFFSKDTEHANLSRFSYFSKNNNKKNVKVFLIDDDDEEDSDFQEKEEQNQKDPWLEEFDAYFKNRVEFWNQFIELLSENEKIVLEEYIKGTKIQEISNKIKKSTDRSFCILRSIKDKIQKNIKEDSKLNKIREELMYV